MGDFAFFSSSMPGFAAVGKRRGEIARRGIRLSGRPSVLGGVPIATGRGPERATSSCEVGLGVRFRFRCSGKPVAEPMWEAAFDRPPFRRFARRTTPPPPQTGIVLTTSARNRGSIAPAQVAVLPNANDRGRDFEAQCRGRRLPIASRRRTRHRPRRRSIPGVLGRPLAMRSWDRML